MNCSILTPSDLPNIVDLLKFAPSLDQDSSTVADDSSYPTPLAIGVRCSAQPKPPSRDSSQQRIGEFYDWVVLFAADYGLQAQDRMCLHLGCNGAIRKLVVVGVRDLSGLGQVWEARAYELR